MVTREDLISQSIMDLLRAGLTERGYAGDVDIEEAHDYEPTDHLERTAILGGFDFDDPGEAAECGSDLIRRLYTVQFFVHGTTNTMARNVANVIKFIFDGERAAGVPLKAVDQAGQPQIDTLEVIGVNAERQIILDPEPWQEFTWIATLRVEDLYYASLV